LFRKISEQQEILSEQARRDPLTGIRNRRSFNDLAEAEIARMRRMGTEAAILMIDIDFFKKVNDTYGHGVGDDVTKKLCAVTEELIRGSDVFTRMGGEEFTVFLPESPK
jgi:diguanylate cyclase (GGDEF)-like protein